MFRKILNIFKKKPLEVRIMKSYTPGGEDLYYPEYKYKGVWYNFCESAIHTSDTVTPFNVWLEDGEWYGNCGSHFKCKKLINKYITQFEEHVNQKKNWTF